MSSLRLCPPSEDVHLKDNTQALLGEVYCAQVARVVGGAACAFDRATAMVKGMVSAVDESRRSVISRHKLRCIHRCVSAARVAR